MKVHVLEHIETLSTSSKGKKELTYTSFFDRDAKLDVRNWRNEDGVLIPGKGVTLSVVEAIKLTKALLCFLQVHKDLIPPEYRQE